MAAFWGSTSRSMTIPVALSIDLPSKRVMRTFIDGKDIVVWRSTSGQLSAWENRCPHRGMRLSHGFVRGENLACLYHGWHYGKAGNCTYIPAHPDMEPPATIQPAKYGVTEQDNVIWVSVTDAVKPATLPADLAPLRSLTFQASPQDIIAAVQAAPCQGNPVRTVETGVDRILCQIDGMGASRTIALLFNATAPDATVAHVLANSGAGAGEKSILSRWCEHLRRVAETLATQKATA